MIKLKNVSKFYYSKGVIATGFTKVNLEFKIGEFVAITGESGSGKSTLLNVISGLDSYEEGEMYIDGKETSHYLEKDWEIYRRKNIGNIYQNFNLVNSYTVYQNIDLVLSLNGISKDERKKKINELLKRVDMYKYRKTKVSKLSGGQKQRIAIARALAKDVPVIIADEPTGSLDKRSAANIIKLLKEISEDKLVIIVTHNYEQVSEYVTRAITMHDGKVLEDKKFKQVEEESIRCESSYKNITLFNKIRLGFRNTFNVVPKFILLFLVYAFIVAALMGEYSFFKKNEYEMDRSGYNEIFKDTDDKRVVLNKKDKTEFSLEEFDNIKKMKNVKSVIKNDVIVDQDMAFTNEDEMLWMMMRASDMEQFDGKVDLGRLPSNPNEVVIAGDKDNYYLSSDAESILDHKFYMMGDNGEKFKDKEIVIVGIKYMDLKLDYIDFKIYLSDELLDKVLFDTHQKYSTITIDFMGENHTSGNESNSFKLETNNWVTPGTAIIPEDFNSRCDKDVCINKNFNVKVENQYYSVNRDFKIEKNYNQKNINKILELNNYIKEDFEENYNGKIYINPLDYNELFNKGTYQMSVYVDDIENLDGVVAELDKMGYRVLKVKDTLVDLGSTEIMKILKLIVTCALIFVLFFISYFIIKIILKSRNTYFSVLRMLGASKNVCRELLIIELLVISNLSYFIFIGLAEINKTSLLNIEFINTVNTYFKLNDYIVLYVVLTLMSLLISIKYAAKLFKNSVMSVYREEV